MVFGLDKNEKDWEKSRYPEDDDWEGMTRLCPECEGRGFVYHPGGEKELCMTCDGLGVIEDA